VRGQEDRQPLLLGEPLHLDPHRGARLGIEAGRGLVEEEDARPVDESERDVEAPLHPARVAAHDAIRRVDDPDQLEQLVDAGAQVVAGEALDPPLEHEVLSPGRLAVDARLLRDVADRAADAVRLPDRVVAGDERAAGVRLRQRRQHADGRRLARAVRAEQAEDLAAAHGERHAREGLDLPVALLQPLRDDRVHGARV
jgi:hypothetical protein